MILVTGATGFLGGHLVGQLLDQGKQVRILCRSQPHAALFDADRTEVVLGDVTRPATLGAALQGVREVYHVAGRVDFNPRDSQLLLAVNEAGTRNLFRECQQHQVQRVVHVSSVSTIGATSDPARPLTEEDFGCGLGVEIPYPQSKLRGEKVALEFADRGLPVVIVNPTFFAGPGDLYLSSARTMLAFVHGQVWVGLTTGGLGLTDVRDIAQGMIAAMHRGVPGRRYILGGQNLLLREYHQLLGKLTGQRPPRLRLPPTVAMALAVIGLAGYRLLGLKTYVGLGDIRMGKHYWLYDYTRAREELGLTCRPTEETIRETLAWLAEQGHYSPRSRT